MKKIKVLIRDWIISVKLGIVTPTSHDTRMPRIPTSVLIRAYQETPLLPLLLQECRTLSSARNELRWLRERALRDSQSPRRGSRGWRTRLRSMCQQRSRGVPLQYILGDQPFGDLEILCQRGVLIPRFDASPTLFQCKIAERCLPGLILNPSPFKPPI